MKNKILKFTDENIEKKWDYENGFYLTSDVSRIGKLIAHYELYKKVADIPGDIMEFGVYKGASFNRFATYRELLENTHSRKIIGFDMFGKFPRTNNSEDDKFIEKFESEGGEGIDKNELEKFLDRKGIKNIELVEGEISSTLDSYLEKNKHIKIALLHIDVDVYGITKLILEKLYDRVVKGGVIVFDDYNAVKGATDAIDEFLEDKVENLNKLSFSYIPTYLIKK